MDIILTQDVINLGDKGDVVNVKPGYARNYLIPQGLAITANKSNLKMFEENKRQAAHKEEKAREDAQNTAQKLQDSKLELKAKTGTSGKIFGTITALQVSSALKEKGFDIDRRRIAMPNEVSTIGEYTAKIKLYKDIEAELTFEVVPES